MLNYSSKKAKTKNFITLSKNETISNTTPSHKGRSSTNSKVSSVKIENVLSPETKQKRGNFFFT